MSEIPAFPYDILWEERQLRSVANLTRRDGEELLPLAAEAGVRPQVTSLSAWRGERGRSPSCAPGAVEGSAVLAIA